ncbi:MAG: carboxy terminal-processing peptidase, partial [Methanococcaceae archaeon]
LPWDQIPPASYEPYEKMGNLLSVLNEKHEERMKNNPEFLSLLETIKEHKEDRKKKTVSLLESARKKERDEEEQKKLERENLGRQAEGLKLLKKGEVAPKEEKQHDFLLKETANVVTDMFISQKAAAK